MKIDFYFGLGSRYSYLAATQVACLVDAGAELDWRPIYSPDLIRRTGPDPFASSSKRGQYATTYRAQDAQRWAAHYGVAYHDPGDAAVDWHRVAQWAVAARLLGRGVEFSTWALSETFAFGRPLVDEGALAEGAASVGLDVAAIHHQISSGAAHAHHADLVDRADQQGAFGVPTFVAADGTLFWGQDRLPLMLDFLASKRT